MCPFGFLFQNLLKSFFAVVLHILRVLFAACDLPWRVLHRLLVLLSCFFRLLALRFLLCPSGSIAFSARRFFGCFLRLRQRLFPRGVEGCRLLILRFA